MRNIKSGIGHLIGCLLSHKEPPGLNGGLSFLKKVCITITNPLVRKIRQIIVFANAYAISLAVTHRRVNHLRGFMILQTS